MKRIILFIAMFMLAIGSYAMNDNGSTLEKGSSGRRSTIKVQNTHVKNSKRNMKGIYRITKKIGRKQRVR
jgi:hypothetical protein